MMKNTSVTALIVFGWLAYAVLGLMLCLPLLDWLQRSGGTPTLVLAALAMCAGWLLRHPLAALALWLGLRL